MCLKGVGHKNPVDQSENTQGRRRADSVDDNHQNLNTLHRDSDASTTGAVRDFRVNSSESFVSYDSTAKNLHDLETSDMRDELPSDFKQHLEKTDNSADIGIKGVNNSKKVAESLPLLRAVGIDLADYGLDGNKAPVGTFKKMVGQIRNFRPRLPNFQSIKNLTKTGKQQLKELDKNYLPHTDRVKNAAKVTQNTVKVSQAPNSTHKVEEKMTKTIEESEAPDALGVGVASVSLMEYAAGIKGAINALNDINAKTAKVKTLKTNLQSLLEQAQDRVNEKQHFLNLQKGNDNPDLVPRYTNWINEINDDLKELNVNISQLSNTLDSMASRSKLSADKGTNSLKIFRYCLSISSVSLALAAKAASGGVAGGLVLAANEASLTAGALATILDGDSLVSTIKKAGKSETFKVGLDEAITNYKQELRDLESEVHRQQQALEAIDNNSKLEILRLHKSQTTVGMFDVQNNDNIKQEDARLFINLGNNLQKLAQVKKNLDLATMILKKQPGTVENALNITSKIATTSAYASGTISAGASILLFAGVTGAAGVTMVASPVGWTLGATGAAITLGLAANKAKVHYFHHKELKSTINQAVGNTKGIEQQVTELKEQNRTPGKAHDLLMTQLDKASGLPGISSRSGVESIVDSLIHEFNDLFDGSATEDLSPKIWWNPETKEPKLLNPLGNSESYSRYRVNSPTIQFLKDIVKDKSEVDLSMAIDSCMEAIRVGQVQLAKKLIGALLHIKP